MTLRVGLDERGGEGRGQGRSELVVSEMIASGERVRCLVTGIGKATRTRSGNKYIHSTQFRYMYCVWVMMGMGVIIDFGPFPLFGFRR